MPARCCPSKNCIGLSTKCQVLESRKSEAQKANSRKGFGARTEQGRMISFYWPQMGVAFYISHPIGLACRRGHLEIFAPCATTLFSRSPAEGGIVGLGTVKTQFWHLFCPQIGTMNRLCRRGQYDFSLRAENGFVMRTDTTN